MKKIKIVGILTILVIVIDIVASVADAFSTTKSPTFSSVKYMPYTLHVVNQTAPADSVFNAKMNKQVPYELSEIQVGVDNPVWLWLLIPFILIAFLAYLLGFYRLIKLLIAVLKKNVFTDRNVHYLRFYAYSQAILIFLFWIYDKLSVYYASLQIELPGYLIQTKANIEIDWTLIMITILFAEIFAIGVKIKEEQDLTV